MSNFSDEKNLKFSDDRTDIDDTVHYLSPASLTTVSLHGEDDKYPLPTSALLRYLHTPRSGYSGEYPQASVVTSTKTFEVDQLERTLAILKPDIVQYEDVVLRKIQQVGFKILQKRKIHLTPEQVSEVYASHYGRVSFPYVVVSMSSGPVIVLCLASVRAVERWKAIVNGTGRLHTSWFFPRSIRIRFGVLETLENVLHASEDLYNANREIRFFFPQMILEPLLKGEQAIDYLSLYVNPTMLNGLTELCKKKPIEPILYFAEWLLVNNPYQPKMEPEIAKLPT